MAGSTKPLPVPAAASGDPAADEENQVHEVYEAIAPHFARTRFKQPWPLIERFLSTLPPNSLGLDAGAGNGKYLPAAQAAGHYAIAMDRSGGLLSIARGQLEGGAECILGDLCQDPWRPNTFDFAISVAAIHHLSTPERRADAVQTLIRPLRNGGRFFIYVWAYEQGPNSRRKMGSLADQKEGMEGGERVQDVLVPWVLSSEPGKKKDKAPKVKGRRKQGEEGAEPEPAPETSNEGPKEEEEEEPKVFHRYYHLFVEGELEDLVRTAAKQDGYAVLGKEESKPEAGKYLRVVDVGWEADNWWIEGEVGSA
ncbi:hypothetical protein A1Q1_01231 [Trichosporon asahii var. asahii CBS 2479]|uniref:Methyltransferase type 11 domain-containing protein n=1 Tax=Trichosporon asahii var. asahii (strain ATCC 90039 / CBS 2479 / JCM 2466 / KCTC 7840 / NBRC 103889/ NCYC 2677 / UAMH 7654) TaxID=1186058 RepID=J6F324_TRIAS|nr:hypothetical protein A1Q1_01231 [Trichosporon asahii var. asahii CBS 2479]EJT49602.1 hypothetical protein A1Q1_01231 [Trichosporon asahii var. asahii CBS 2479]